MATRQLECCHNCHYWAQPRDESNLGHCCRYPPVLGTQLPADADALADVTFVWPVTRAEAWCGEWRSLTAHMEN